MSGDPRLSTWKRKRLRRAVKDAGRVNGMWCWRCGGQLDPDGAWHLDETTPRALGGDPEDPAQCRPAHVTCNTSHGARLGNAIRRRREAVATKVLIVEDW